MWGQGVGSLITAAGECFPGGQGGQNGVGEDMEPEVGLSMASTIDPNLHVGLCGYA